MGIIKINLLTAVTLLVGMQAIAWADTVVDPRSKTEGLFLCPDGSCGHNEIRIGNVDETQHFSDLIQNVTLFDNSGRGQEPRRKATENGFNQDQISPIGIIRPNQPIPWGPKILNDVQASAFMVSPCYAMTNNHAVFGTADESQKKTFTSTIELGNNPTTGRPFQVKATPVTWGKWTKGDASTNGGDWALLKTEPCVGGIDGVGWLQLSFKNDPGPAAIVAYYGDKGMRLSEAYSQKNCSLDHKTDGVWFHDCASSPGASGGPVFAIVNGKVKVVAINAGEFKRTDEIMVSKPEILNRAVSILEIIPDLKPFLDADMKAFKASRGNVDNPAPPLNSI